MRNFLTLRVYTANLSNTLSINEISITNSNRIQAHHPRKYKSKWEHLIKIGGGARSSGGSMRNFEDCLFRPIGPLSVGYGTPSFVIRVMRYSTRGGSWRNAAKYCSFRLFALIAECEWIKYHNLKLSERVKVGQKSIFPFFKKESTFIFTLKPTMRELCCLTVKKSALKNTRLLVASSIFSCL